MTFLGAGHGRHRLAGDIINDLRVNVFSGEGHAEPGLPRFSTDPQTNP
jgi:hypothetical protein